MLQNNASDTIYICNSYLVGLQVFVHIVSHILLKSILSFM